MLHRCRTAYEAPLNTSTTASKGVQREAAAGPSRGGLQLLQLLLVLLLVMLLDSDHSGCREAWAKGGPEMIFLIIYRSRDGFPSQPPLRLKASPLLMSDTFVVCEETLSDDLTSK